MRTDLFKSRSGFTFIAALFIMVVMGIMLGAAAQSWQTTMKREREEELLFRGSQIRDAIIRWNKPPVVGGSTPSVQSRKLTELKQLLEDPNSAQKIHYLRRLYLDPITGKDFVPIQDQVKGIIGVYSPSTDQPLKQANFPDEFKEFGNKKKYSDWQFVYKPGAAPGGTISVSPTSGGTPPGSPPPFVPIPPAQP